MKTVPLPISETPELDSKAGEDVTLHCRFKITSSFELQNIRLFWLLFRNGKRVRVHSYYNGTDSPEDQEEEFKDRTQLFLQQLSQGVTSLTLSNARPSDSGLYRCIIADNQDATIRETLLQVAAPYEPPQITALYNKEDNVLLQCKSQRGYPEAELTWQDANGNELTPSEPTEFLRTSEGVFQVLSNLSVSTNKDPIVCCSITHKVLLQHLTNCEKITAKWTPFQELLERMKMEKYSKRKLTLNHILESFKDQKPHALEDLPRNFLRKVMALNGTARSTTIMPSTSEEQGSNREKEQGIDETIFSHNDPDTTESLHPLDVLCAVLLCSDSFLQQEILSRMSMCQFSLPLLLPAINTPKGTLMLWAMRDIVRKWRPHSLAESRGFREESLVLTKMPTVSFVRLGSCSFSKSKLLNEVLSPSQQHHNFFIHRDMESGNVPREIADGLVEISWYFPAGRENLDLFPEPVAVTNLRGDIESHWLQFGFLTEVSSAVFIVTESISEREYELLSSLQGSKAKFYFILNPPDEKCTEILQSLKKLAPLLNFNKSHLLVKNGAKNKAQFVKKVQFTIGRIMNSSHKRVNVEDMAMTARKIGIQVDEDCEECQRAKEWTEEITGEIEDIAEYKRKMLRLQGRLWKDLAEVEKELYQMKGQNGNPVEINTSKLKEKWLELRTEQNKCDFSGDLAKFTEGIGHVDAVRRHYFLKWFKLNLDCIARGNLSKLLDEYERTCDPIILAELDESLSASSLGVEHFLRELGQFYEAEYSMVKEGKMPESQKKFSQFPSIAADLMLEGFPMELIDGDASNIPLQWVTDVLTELHTKLGGSSKMLVLTVLGVQSTGKSTLLNTMFGLQFAVRSGRCTRGAFMSLIKVTGNLKEDLHCDFILVIDTQGLKAPQLAQLENSYEHDNELATLVVGLSDITIINVAMKNATEMQDILQIVVHAFLRMEEIGQKPICQFVHHNINDVSAEEQYTRDRKYLLEQLNEMTKLAAKKEKRSREVAFSDIMDYVPEKHNWYIPSLWHGVPPMARVNIGYSENVCELKKFLVNHMINHSLNMAPRDIPQFNGWMTSLWNFVKYGKSPFTKSPVTEVL
ncbi:up-regulator of cell proliferation-like [Mauremys mutica]|uniref:up-regulator of cell proliferation-like n=1 Tax=Mauremys mutica TaxID=74926 RepID=UPI001D1633C0|nr:up-regulator of cell proliferation-like [Mauremys mutica]